MKGKVLVRILSSGYIPFVNGNGPILRPIWITEEQYKTLRTLGINVEKISDSKFKPENSGINLEKVIQSSNEEKQEEIIEESEETEEVDEIEEELEETTEEELTAQSVEENIVEEVEEELVEDSSTEESEKELVDRFYSKQEVENLSKEECKAILELRGKKYPPNMGVQKLRELVLSSNPRK